MPTIDGDLLRYASIPVVAAVIAWTTNWLGIQMAFYPIRFVGPVDPWLGWQGIVPRRAWKMATLAVDSAVTNLATVRELLEMLDPDETMRYLVDKLTPMVPQVVEETARRKYPEIWAALPQPVRQAVYDRCAALLPQASDRAMADVLEHVDSLLDARLMMIEQLAGNPKVLVDTMMEAGRREFWFLINSGAVFGLLLGLVQMGLTIGFPQHQWWILPAFGVVVGYATNWLAFQMIFAPPDPRRIGPFTLQGAMLKRKSEIARHFAGVAAYQFATLDKAVERMRTGPNADRVRALIHRHAKPLVDEALSIAAPAARVALGGAEYERIRTELAVTAEELGPELISDEAFVRSRGAMVEEEMYRRLYGLSNAEFVGLLRPVVEEDEWILYAVGGALGLASGIAQVLLLFSGVA